MSTRIISTLVFIGLMIASLSSGRAAEPVQLTSLRKSWEQARDRAAQPLDAGYLADLQKLLDTFTRSNQLEEALAVKNEIQSVAGNAGVAASNAATPVKRPAQLETLRKAWLQSRDKAVQPSDAVYARELQKLQESYAKAGQLEDALAAKNELEKVGKNSAIARDEAPASRQSKSFVGKKWTTTSGSHFTFKADGTGTQANPAGKKWPLRWTPGPDDLLTVEGWMDDRKATLYFKFKSREGFFGSNPENLDKQIVVK
ncbi:hypothetical protein [Prosthecobacter sp.]|uniref:hypothetical protein n=1 Tax=Prosthecobacter sp. TaxID=1965333 RepID=UPI003784C38E